MIHVVCPNPAVDKLFAIDGFTPGEDYPGQTPRVRAGGKGVNVARVLSQLGEAPRLYAFLGETGGEIIEGEMNQRCSCVFVRVPGACRTTINIIDRTNDRETVITESGPCIDEEHVSRLFGALERALSAGDIVCCSGSIITGAPRDLYARISRLCMEAGACCALDCNAKTLADSMGNACYVLGKPNERELAALLHVPRTRQTHEIAAMARRLMPPYRALLVSMGSAGGMMVMREEAWIARVPSFEVVSTVGSGDAAFAGALCAMAKGLDARAQLRLAMACGVANAAGERTGSIETVWQLAQEIEIAACTPGEHC